MAPEPGSTDRASAEAGQPQRPYAAPLLFGAMALVWCGGALLSGGAKVCALDSPDTWMHLWAFWRTRFALGGGDLGYFSSHLLAYPGQHFEIIALFDPLLPLAAAPLSGPLSPAGAYNGLCAAGLLFSAWAGARLCRRFTRVPGLALLGGVVIAFNPFLFRLLGGGFLEYAFVGLVPLCLDLYLGALEAPGRRPPARTLALHAACFVALCLLSVYCAVFYLFLVLFLFLGHALAALGRAGARPRLLRSLWTQLSAGAALLPLLLGWLLALGELEFRGITPPPAQQSAAAPADEGEGDYLRWRVRSGSADLADLTLHNRSSRPWPGDPGVLPRRFEAVFLAEWLPVIGLALLGLGFARVRRSTAGWLAAAGFFLLLALGPRLLWAGQPLSAIPLPYAWLRDNLPGFSRLVVPGRAFLLCIVVLALLSVRGLDLLLGRLAPKLDPRGKRLLGPVAAAGLFLLFPGLGDTAPNLPLSETRVPGVYGRLADEPAGALLELPGEGALARRMLAQTVHQRPIYRGLLPEVFVEVRGAEPVANSPLVRWLEGPGAPPPPAETFQRAAAELARLGFSHLLLHRDGFSGDEQAYHRALGHLRAALGRPLQRDPAHVLWRLGR